MNMSLCHSVKSGTKAKQTVALDDVYGYLRSDRMKELIGDRPDGFKDRLPAVTPAAVYPTGKRKKGEEESYSGLCVIDFDGVADPSTLRDTLFDEHESVAMAFISPSGKGVKLFISIEPVPKTPAEYTDAWKQVASQFDDVDPSGKDVARLCYLSYDPDARRRLYPKPFRWVHTPKPDTRQNTPDNPVGAARLIDALEYIDTDFYDTWIKVGTAIKFSDLPYGEGFSIWNDWSRKSLKHNPEEMQMKWDSFEQQDFTIASVFHAAKENGWQPVRGQQRQADIMPEDYTPEDVDAEPASAPVLPESAYQGIFRLYRDATTGRSEVCDEFRMASLMTAAGASLGKSVRLQFGDSYLYPNFYTCLVGQSARSKKSTAADDMVRVFQDDEHTISAVGLNFLSSLSTPEGLLDIIDDNGDMNTQCAHTMANNEGIRLLVHIDEFATLLSKAKNKVSAGIIPRLTTAYDFPKFLSNPTKENRSLATNPCLSLICASTKAWLEKTLSGEDIHGGFANRFVYFAGSQTEPHAFPLKAKPEPMAELMDCLAGDRVRFADNPTEYTVTTDAAAMYVDWYNKRFAELDKTENEDIVGTLLGRNSQHALKIALLDAAYSNDVDDTQIGTESMSLAIAMGDYWQDTVKFIFSKFALSKDVGYENIILDILKANVGIMRRRDLQRKAASRGVSATYFKRAMDSLDEHGTIRMYDQETERGQSPKMVALLA